MKIRYLLAAVLLISFSPVQANVGLSGPTIVGNEFDLTATWDEVYPGHPSGLVVDFITAPWLFAEVGEFDDTGVSVSSGAFSAFIGFNGSRKFSDASVQFSVNPLFTATIEPVVGNEFAAHFHATYVPESSAGWAGLLCVVTLFAFHRKSIGGQFKETV